MTDIACVHRHKICAACGSDFSCGADSDTPGACWCMTMPPLFALDAAADCFCPGCLRDAIAIERQG